jgi:hypothetical protein
MASYESPTAASYLPMVGWLVQGPHPLAGGCLGEPETFAGCDHQRNAKLQLTVVLAPPEVVPGLYVHPDHRRRRLRAAVRSELDV